ncbi:uncharacterized protein LOC120536162 [Polypterus senegalus]|uniref:uncharacterized protein LOC120536162 n=1 Tax=Polypterus senegalus TaxID=55291 RepID=UPI0019629482|nr:uncharacterized protein LOC120536162 [Polypterus senegalus]
MDAPLALLALLLLVLLVSAAEAHLTVWTSQAHPAALLWSDIHLQCSFTVTPGPIDPSRLKVTWTHRGLSIAKYNDRTVTTRPNVMLDGHAVERGDVSVIISKIYSENEGLHRCEVEYEGEKGEVDMIVTVTMDPQVHFILKADDQISQVNLTCLASSYFPPNITLIIKRNGDILKTERVTSNESPSSWSLAKGTSNAESVYAVDVTAIRDSDALFTCEVTHETADKPIVRDLIKLEPPVVSLVGSAVLHKNSMVVCHAESVTQSAMIFTWRRNEEVMKTDTPPMQWTYKGILFAESSYQFTPSIQEPVSCEVENVAAVSERRYVTYTGLTLEEVIRIPVTIIIIIFLTLFILWWSSVGLFPLVPLKVDSVPRALQCTLTGWHLQLVTVEWSRNDQQICVEEELTDLEDGDVETLRDPPEYSVKRLPLKDLCCLDGNVLRLEMKPTTEETEGAKFKCRATHRLTRRSLEYSLEI